MILPRNNDNYSCEGIRMPIEGYCKKTVVACFRRWLSTKVHNWKWAASCSMFDCINTIICKSTIWNLPENRRIMLFPHPNIDWYKYLLIEICVNVPHQNRCIGWIFTVYPFSGFESSSRAYSLPSIEISTLLLLYLRILSRMAPDWWSSPEPTILLPFLFPYSGAFEECFWGRKKQ